MEFLLLFLFTLVSTCNSLAGDNVCSRGYQNESGKLVVIKYCCKGFQEKNNMCVEVECDPGFRGDYCNKTCPDGYYGEKCLPKCKCNRSQFCHHVCGCLQWSNTTDNITTNNTEVVSLYSVETCFSSPDTSTDSTEVTQTARPNQEVTQTARPDQIFVPEKTDQHQSIIITLFMTWRKETETWIIMQDPRIRGRTCTVPATVTATVR
uniref:Protein draper-like n=1 Tax=Crassostrea virginica TaxID=6565 RepID=A0A8B8ESE6_CRAVI|nr:protein draper-like [Crassostrea virginica]